MLNRTHALLDLCLRERPARWNWVISLTLFLAALLARLALQGLLPQGFPFITFLPAVVLTTLVCGLWYGMAVTFASGFCAWLLFIQPQGGYLMNQATAMTFFASLVTVDVLLIASMRGALRRLRAESARQSRERELSQQLAHTREVMLQEVQHRVSNNLQMLAAMMLLQRGAVRDPEARRIIDTAAQRLELIARIQRNLQQPQGGGLPFHHLLRSLCGDVLVASGARGVAATIEADPITLPPEQTVPVALIVAELVANAVEHGFAGRERGDITITLLRQEETLQLNVEDNGAGPPPGFTLEGSNSLGLRIVRALAQQIGGRFEMHPLPRGTACRLSFPAPKEEEE
ncbi:ATP-binding protein [Roseomonas sp. GC11]|uniref:ATP-binding protein n=1 Tax=Roseomonas sp. GC11 TaxID=2950546 RepID=UPI00210DEE20|nr:ATP-binding protein [Roseomonas sp. GC11]MCQ4162637.1 ATP-binding protein [Roseomonas sp. GC11]